MEKADTSSGTKYLSSPLLSTKKQTLYSILFFLFCETMVEKSCFVTDHQIKNPKLNDSHHLSIKQFISFAKIRYINSSGIASRPLKSQSYIPEFSKA